MLGGRVEFEEAVAAVLVVVKGGGRDHFGVQDHAFGEEAEQETEVSVDLVGVGGR